MNLIAQVDEAEALLAVRNVHDALLAFSRAEAAGADQDRCAGGRWHCYMLLGDYESAWRESDFIRKRGAPDPHRVWDGKPARSHERVLIRSAHGFGDAVHMLRFVPLLGAREVTVQAAPEVCELLRLLPGVDKVVSWGEEPEFDAQLEVTELAYCVRATATQVGRACPYLQVTPAELPTTELPRVGLVWMSSGWNPSRALPFPCLLPLLEAGQGRVEFWSLQPFENNHAWREHAAAHGLPTHCAAEGTVVDLARAIAAMDHVITVDTFAAHLAGAMGKPVTVLLERYADWRWMLDREDTPWYPTMRLLRQHDQGDWREPIDRAAALLRELD